MAKVVRVAEGAMEMQNGCRQICFGKEHVRTWRAWIRESYGFPSLCAGGTEEDRSDGRKPWIGSVNYSPASRGSVALQCQCVGPGDDSAHGRIGGFESSND